MKTRIYQILFAVLAIFCVQDVFAQDSNDEYKQKPIDDAIIGGASMRSTIGSVTIDEIITDFETDDDDLDGHDGVVNLDNITESRVEMFPNPANRVFTLVMRSRANYQIKIYDLSGKIIDQSFYADINSISIDVSAYAPSLYFVHIEGANVNETQKLKVSR